jgi:hypothetical protein
MLAAMRVPPQPLAPLVRGSLLAALLCAGGLGGCTTWSNEIHQAELAYDEARPDAALAWLDVVGDDNVGRMELQDRARYLYVRGMTEFRLGRRDDALYHLAMAREVAGGDGVGLRREQRELMDRTLAELTPTEHMSHRPPPPASGE